MLDEVRPLPRPSLPPRREASLPTASPAARASVPNPVPAPPVTTPGGIVVVIPTFNERDNLPVCVERVLSLGPAYRVIIVDDNSPDGTGAIADELARRHPGRVEVLHRPRKAGLGPAYVAGFRAALAAEPDLIAAMDADLSHDPADLPRLVAAVSVADPADLALGSRYVAGGGTRGWPLYRRMLSRFGGRYAATVLAIPIADPTSGFKVYRRATLAGVDLDTIRADGYAFNIEMTYRALRRGGRIAEVPIVFTDRVAGASKLSRRIMLEAMIVVWRLRFDRNGILSPHPRAEARDPTPPLPRTGEGAGG